MKPGFEVIFIRLRKILKAHAGSLRVSVDQPDHYCLEAAPSLKIPKAYPAAWLKIGKAYVSYHLMPVYMFPELMEGSTDKLRKRMQGKSCFNFKTLDEELFQELEDLTSAGFKLCRERGYGGEAQRQSKS